MWETALRTTPSVTKAGKIGNSSEAGMLLPPLNRYMEYLLKKNFEET
jgi:hypothetical protein